MAKMEIFRRARLDISAELLCDIRGGMLNNTFLRHRTFWAKRIGNRRVIAYLRLPPSLFVLELSACGSREVGTQLMSMPLAIRGQQQ